MTGRQILLGPLEERCTEGLQGRAGVVGSSGLNVGGPGALAAWVKTGNNGQVSWAGKAPSAGCVRSCFGS